MAHGEDAGIAQRHVQRHGEEAEDQDLAEQREVVGRDEVAAGQQQPERDFGRARLARRQGDGFHASPFLGTMPFGRNSSIPIMKT